MDKANDDWTLTPDELRAYARGLAEGALADEEHLRLLRIAISRLGPAPVVWTHPSTSPWVYPLPSTTFPQNTW